MSGISRFSLGQCAGRAFDPYTDIFSNPFDSNPLQNTIEKFLTNNVFHINFISKDLPITFVNDEAFLDLGENDFNHLLNAINNKGFKIHIDTLRLFIKSAAYSGYTEIVLALLKTIENPYQYQTFLTLSIAYAASNNRMSTLNSLKSLLREANIPMHYLDLPAGIFKETIEAKLPYKNPMPLFTLQAMPRSLFDFPEVVTTFPATSSFLPPIYETLQKPGVVFPSEFYLLGSESQFPGTVIEIPSPAASKTKQKHSCSPSIYLLATTVATVAAATIINTYYYQFI